jgi:hypothetical protein
MAKKKPYNWLPDFFDSADLGVADFFQKKGYKIPPNIKHCPNLRANGNYNDLPFGNDDIVPQ